MLCVIPFFSGDVSAAARLLRWIADLGGCPGHHCLLVADATTPWNEAMACLDLARQSFLSSDLVTNEAHVEGWIPGSNSLFKAAAQHAQDRGQSFLILEPDAVPLKAGWLDTIETAYHAMPAGKQFMGTLVYHSNPTWPNPYFEGVGVHPPDTWRRVKDLFRSDVAWPQALAGVTGPLASNSALFHHLWGEVGNPPKFAKKNVPGTNVFCPQQIDPAAVIFHRNKDGSLIRLLREERGLAPESVTELAVFLPFCHMDYPLMLKSVSWMAQMHGKLPRTAILHHDGTVSQNVVARITQAARSAFANVIVNSYPTPQRPYIGWPAAPNWSFMRACEFMLQHEPQPWLWFEADAVALKPDWLYRLEAEYGAGGQPFMGPIIGDFDGLHMGHMNGGGVYPWNTAQIIPKAFIRPGQAWDTQMKPEMIHLTHPANRLMQHCGAVVNGCCKPANGPLAKFPNQNLVDTLVNPTSVYFHPCKDGSLVDRLRERAK